jgi:aspartate ammonia-lyase
MRTEFDFIGSKTLPDDALYGINALRACENFPDSTAFQFEWYKSLGVVKQACYLTYKSFKQAALSKYEAEKLSITFFNDHIIEALIDSAAEVAAGKYFNQFIVPAIQGGAGTSINMNVNEIITNVALLKLGKTPGSYDVIDPIEHANIFQSTNDVIPTSLKLCLMQLLKQLEEKINLSRSVVESLERTNRDVLRVAYTQMQEAVPSSFGKLFSAYSDALSRDWWRISKCFERIKLVNLGGSAVGTGVTVPRYFVMEAARTLQTISLLPVTRAENLTDATQNLDAFTEVHAILKSHAVNLEKIASDLRLLAADIVPNHPLSLPKRQIGSSIMPGKVNPVIPEFLVSVAHKVYSNDVLVTSLSGQGCLDLNAYIPLIGHAMIESLKLLLAANQSLASFLLNDLVINETASVDRLMRSPAITTALVPVIGYHKATQLAHYMKENLCTIIIANEKLKLLEPDKLYNLLKPDQLLKTGFSLEDL